MAAEKSNTEKTVDPKTLELLDKLDLKVNEVTPGAPTNRWRYRRVNMNLSIEHPGGGFTKSVCHARMIWREGIALVCTSFSYPGSLCTLVLVSNENDLMSINGTIEVCRHLQGGYHEVEIKFNQRIDPQMFVESTGPGGSNVANVELSSLRARILHLDDSEADAKLLAHHLRASRVELKSCRNAADALAALEGPEPMDIFLCDLNLGSAGDSLPVMRRARENGFTGPIVVVTAESHPSRLAAAKEAGADNVLNKPFTRDTLMNLIVKLHHDVGAIAGEPLQSTLSDQPDIEELLTGYIADVKETSRLIDMAIALKDLDTVRTLCLNIKGAAAGYGFGMLGSAAEDAVRALDATMAIDESRPKLRTLTLMATQLMLRPKAAPVTDPAKDRLVF